MEYSMINGASKFHPFSQVLGGHEGKEAEKGRRKEGRGGEREERRRRKKELCG